MLKAPKKHAVLENNFAGRFAVEWRKRYAKICIFASAVFLIPGALIIIASLGIYLRYEEVLYPIGSFVPIYFMLLYELGGILLSISIAAFLFVFFPAGALMMTAPKVLATIAEGLIERLGLLFLLHIPVTENDFMRNRFMEYFAGAPVADSRINLSFSSRIWWLSGQMKPELLLGGIPKRTTDYSRTMPYKLSNPGLPVGRIGTIIIRQWYLYASQALSWSTCSCSIGCAFILLVPFLIYRVVMNVHTLAYAAAYYRILTDRWPWEA